MHMSWVLIVITVIVFFTTDHRGAVCPHLVGDSLCIRTTCRLQLCMLFIHTGKNALHQTVQCGITLVVLLRMSVIDQQRKGSVDHPWMAAFLRSLSGGQSEKTFLSLNLSHLSFPLGKRKPDF